MRSPLSPVPSLGRRPRRPPAADLLIGVPRISPAHELATIRALIKPQAGDALRHRTDGGAQPWPANGPDRVRAAAAAARRHLGLDVELHLPPAGEYWAVGSCPTAAGPAALAVGLLLSRALPGAWVVVGRAFALDGAFHRRERGVKLTLRPAASVHLTKPARAAYRAALADLTSAIGEQPASPTSAPKGRTR